MGSPAVAASLLAQSQLCFFSSSPGLSSGKQARAFLRSRGASFPFLLSTRRHLRAFSDRSRASPVRCYNAGEESEEKESGSGLDWPVLRRWDVPWQWQTVSLTSLACGVSITTAVTLGVLFGITRSFQPLPNDIFRYDLREPFNLQKGWVLWAGVGLVGAIGAIALTGAAMSFSNGEPPQRETDALVRLLPLIGSSSI
ncbi:hypothetical protein CRG98_004119, partial [Punica granatum]